MSEVEVYRFPATGQAVRTVVRDGEPWFVARDVCDALGIGNPSQAISYLDTDEFEQLPAALISNEGRPQDRLNVVTEAGLYSLILRSRKPEAKAFKRWVTHDVLPAIRRTGRYDVAHRIPRTYAEALELAAKQAREIESAKAELEVTAPKAESWDVLASSEGDYSVREAAYILKRDPAIDTGQNRLFALLREWKLIDRNNRPYANHANHVRLRALTYTDWSGEEQATHQVRITPAGLHYLHKRLGGTKQLRFVLPTEVAS